MIHDSIMGSGPAQVVFLHGLFGQGKNFTRIATSLAGVATCHLLDDMLRDTLTLLTSEARRFTCRPVDDDEVRSPVAEQMFKEAFQTLIVDLLGFGEGGNERHPHPAEGMLTHSLSFYDQYVGRGIPSHKVKYFTYL